jgi:glycosyltransferase involved in cell wall biosynthesis
MALYQLLRQFRGLGYQSTVISLNGIEPVGKMIGSLGVPVIDLRITSVGSFFTGMIELVKIGRAIQPNVLQGWMYHGNIAASLAAPFMGNQANIAWNIRGSLHDMSVFKSRTRKLIRLGALMSGTVDTLIYNSHAGAMQHRAFGYSGACEQVIGNGFGIGQFEKSIKKRNAIREQLRIHDFDIVIGCLGRFHMAKGSDLFLKMALAVGQKMNNVHFIAVGRGMDSSNPQVEELCNHSKLKGRFHAVGEQRDVLAYLSSMDLFVNPSRTEGFPNALAEAMLAELVCIATNVGDSSEILGECGSLIMANNIESLEQSVLEWLIRDPDQRACIGRASRERIASRYSIEKVANAYTTIYTKLSASEDLV